MDVKTVLEKFAKELEFKIEKYWSGEIEKKWGLNDKQKGLVKDVLVHAYEHNKIGGKRLRGGLLYYSYLMSGKKVTESLWNACVAVEIVHTALLMHDDFMDEDKLRRGKPTTHIVYEKIGGKHYGESMAVQIGATALTMGYELLLNSGFGTTIASRATSTLLRHIVETGYGQMFDISLAYLKNWQENDVIALHTTKTAIYTYQNPIFIGAILAELPNEVLPILQDYAYHAGVAFQIQDDILGVFGDPEKTGKSADSDLLQGKPTLLAFKSIELASEIQREKFYEVWGKKQSGRKKIDEVKEIIKKCGALRYNVDFSKNEAKKAIESLNNLKKMGFAGEGVDFLEGIASYMVEREV